MLMQLRSVVIDTNPEDRALVKNVLVDLGQNVDVCTSFEFCPVFQRQAGQCQLSSPCYDIQIVGQTDRSTRAGIDFIHWQRECGCKLATENSAAMSDSWSTEQIQIAEGLGIRLFTKPYLVRNLVDWIYRIKNRH
ncbi:MAG: hypothetical protein C0623_11185 [Desulfuromonas sp.]|nr:MAG: hypothetical protein C0623_11185 [Desulfuromonas sp.]